MLRQTILIAIVALLAGGGSPLQQQGLAPTVISGDLPKYPAVIAQAKILGTVVLKLTTDGERVVAIDAVRPAPMIREAAEASVRTWRFLPHRPTTFDATFTHEYRDLVDPCYNPDTNGEWIVRLPTEVRYRAVLRPLCEREPKPTRTSLRAGRLTGRVICDCDLRTPIDGVTLSVRTPDEEDLITTVTTDATGRFDLRQLKSGRYAVDVSAWGHEDEHFLVTVTGSGSRGTEFRLRADGRYRDAPPAGVLETVLPFYPEQARKAGIQGTARVHVEVTGQVNGGKGPDELVQAAAENVRSWRFDDRPRRAFDVTFNYRLRPADCSMDQNTIVRITLPSVVEVIGKRMGPCPRATSDQIPALTHAEWTSWPIVDSARLEGDVRLRVSTDGSQVVGTEAIGGHGLLANAAQSFVRDWRFEPHRPTTFESTIRFANRDGRDCNGRDPGPQHDLLGRLPTDVTLFNAGPIWICDPTASVWTILRPVRRLRGVARCDCPSKRLFANREIQIRSGEFYRVDKTDAAGRFDLGTVPAGRITVMVAGDGVYSSWQQFEVIVDPQASDGELVLPMRPEPNTKLAPPDPTPPTIELGKIPDYPPDLRRRGIEGVVVLRITGNTVVEPVTGPAALADAASAILATWRFERVTVPVLARFRYGLTAGDCDGDQNPTVIVRRWPIDVEIMAKRIVPCG